MSQAGGGSRKAQHSAGHSAAYTAQQAQRAHERCGALLLYLRVVLQIQVNQVWRPPVAQRRRQRLGACGAQEAGRKGLNEMGRSVAHNGGLPMVQSSPKAPQQPADRLPTARLGMRQHLRTPSNPRVLIVALILSKS